MGESPSSATSTTATCITSALAVSAPTTVNELLRVVVGQNRLIKYLGYDSVVYYEDAPEFAGAETVSAPA
jgi:hypothetical protein